MTKTNSDKQSTYQNGVPPLLREQSSKPIQIGIAINGLVKALPLHDLAPDEFERLCLRLIEREVDVEAHATLYGRSGQKQHGIDIYTQRHDTREHWVYQCKRYEEYDSSKLNKSVGLFVCNWQVAQGQEPTFVGLPPKKKPSKTVSEETESKEYTPPKWFAEIKRFVICITTDFGKNTN